MLRTHHDDVRRHAEEFAAWFGDSKVVKPAGDPRMLFHGSAADFETFDAARAGANFGVDEEGLFFTSNTAHDVVTSDGAITVWEDAYSAGAYAKHAAEGTGLGARIVPVYLRISAPLTLEQVAWAYGYDDVERMLDGRHPQDLLDLWKPQLIEMMRTAGCDGIAFDNGHDDVFFVTDPEQVRFALDYRWALQQKQRNPHPRRGPRL
jgi:hypothetical protein